MSKIVMSRQVMVFGTFATLHPGHINFFKQAKKYGDFLTVVIARDQTVKSVKGAVPVNSENDRKRLVGELKIVDRVLLGSKGDKLAVVKREKPDVVCLGYDQIFFVDLLKKEFPKLKIVRLKSYRAEIYKSSKLG